MSGGIEAVGDIATGTLWARSVEPSAAAAHAHRPGALCLNCGTRLTGSYCHACGQPEHIHRTLGTIWHDLAHGAFHFEGKIWRTLPMLALHPGALTRRYIAGERARFVSPLALFLFVVFLSFAVLSIAGVHLEISGGSAAKRATELRNLTAARTQAQSQLTALQGQRVAALARHVDPDDLDDMIAAQQATLRAVQVGLAAVQAGESQRIGRTDIHTGWARLDEGAQKGVENPNLLLYKLQSNAYKYSWALIPISTPFIWLLFFWRRDLHLYDHAVFVTYSLCFVSLLILVVSLLSAAGLGKDWIALATLVVPVHWYRQLRGAYRIGRLGAGLRTLMLSAFAIAALILFAVLLLGLGLVG